MSTPTSAISSWAAVGPTRGDLTQLRHLIGERGDCFGDRGVQSGDLRAEPVDVVQRLWRVRGRLGGDGGQEVSYNFPGEASARAMVDRMMKTSAGTRRDLTKAVRQESDRRQTH